MSEPRWTPGPWQAVKSFDPDFSFAICAQPHPALRGFTHIIAGIRETDDAEAAEANARLIAAAPDLLEALRELTIAAEAAGWDQDRQNLPSLNIARAAISKATGGK